MTPGQIRILHLAARQLKLDDATYRTILRNVGKLSGDEPSCKELSLSGFENVMAFLEERGFQSHPQGAHYWRNKQQSRGKFATERALFYLRELASASRYSLDAMTLKFSNGRTESPDKLTPQEAWRLTEMYKQSAQREAAPPLPLRERQGEGLFPAMDQPRIGLPDTCGDRTPASPVHRSSLIVQRSPIDRGIEHTIPEDVDDIPF